MTTHVHSRRRKVYIMRSLLILFSFVAFACQASAFQAAARRRVAPSPSAATTATALYAGAKRLTSKLPTFDKASQRWISNDSDADGAYGPLDSLLRFGPKPFLKRLTDADNVEQAVLKYQAQEQCSRLEAECNMDAFNENVQDWIQQKT